LDISKVRLAALLHDISAIMTPQEMYETAKSRNMKIDPAEEKYHFLLHQRISKIIAEERFGIIDKEILSAVECHTTLKKNAGMYDKVIFIADKISWDQKDLPPYYDILKSKAAESLDDACYYFIRYQFDNGLLLMPHQWLNEAYEELKKSQNT
jgi:HD superfamily phosphohydrolase YqeK